MLLAIKVAGLLVGLLDKTKKFRRSARLCLWRFTGSVAGDSFHRATRLPIVANRQHVLRCRRSAKSRERLPRDPQASGTSNAKFDHGSRGVTLTTSSGSLLRPSIDTNTVLIQSSDPYHFNDEASASKLIPRFSRFAALRIRSKVLGRTKQHSHRLPQ